MSRIDLIVEEEFNCVTKSLNGSNKIKSNVILTVVAP